MDSVVEPDIRPVVVGQPDPPAPEPTPRQKVRAWVRGEVAGAARAGSAVVLPEMKRRMVDHFSADPAFVRAWLAETLDAVAYDEAQAVCAQTRRHVVFGDEIVTRIEFGQRVRARRPRWAMWMEFVGDRHVRLWDMRRDDLLTAAALREERGAEEYKRAALWRALAERMRGKKTVGEVFTEDEVSKLAEELDVRIDVRAGVVAVRAEAAD